MSRMRRQWPLPSLRGLGRSGSGRGRRLVPFQLDPARGSAQRACDWLWGGLVENLVQIVGTALEPSGPAVLGAEFGGLR
jgi:hypothetical protein